MTYTVRTTADEGSEELQGLLARDAPIVEILRAAGPVLRLARDDARRIAETFDALVKEWKSRSSEKRESALLEKGGA